MTDYSTADVGSLLRQANQSRERLILAIGPNGSGKTSWLRELAAAHGLTYLPIGAPLSRALGDLSPRQRPLSLARTLDSLLPAPGLGVCLDNTDLLFAPELQCDPLRLVAQLSQHRLVVAAFTGSFAAGRFTHAYPDHPEYLSVPLSGVTVALFTAGQPSFSQI
ncbi:MAG TPA: BREX-3 system P-loop-containing protein BrxF [Opitutaceae bacterium]|nr:BREX-3 system P-loop-containing protein BrxF [Opitutaceae bacterium]